MMYDQNSLIDKDDPRITELFSKTFLLAMGEDYLLPSQECMFRESSWEINDLQILKDQLNEVKNRLNSYNLNEWHMHTSKRNKAGQVHHRVRRDIRPEFLTQAWCKFYEILSFFDVVPQDEISKNYNCFTSVHLCEAPGAFVTSLNHWLKTNTDFKWNWLATTLNPYYEGNPLSRMINDERFIRHTLDHWDFGEDNTGNLMNLKNLDKLVEKAKVNDDVLLITADGSIDCVDVPGEQEIVVSHLHYCETVAALHLLNKGGSFVIKIFTTFEHTSVCLLYLLSCCFYKVFVTKPATSKEGNSETYVVCMNFKGYAYVAPYLQTLRKYYESGSKAAMFCKKDIHPYFIAKVINCAEFFKKIQTCVIMSNIITFSSNNEVDDRVVEEVKVIQELVAEKYINDCKLKQLPPDCEIVGKDELRKTFTIDFLKRQYCESYDKRRENANMPLVHRLLEYRDVIKEIFDEVPMCELSHFQSSDEKPIHEFVIGKSFHKIYNSRFCERRILNIKIDVEDILDKLRLKKHFPSDEDTDYLLQQICRTSDYKTLILRYTSIYDSSRIISKLWEQIQILSDGDSLVLIGYSLLTHLNVSLLYLLHYAFRILKLKPHDKVGCLIILKHYKNDADILRLWKKIISTENELRNEGKATLSFIPVTCLYDWDAYRTIVKCNNWIIKTYLNYVMDNTLKSINPC
ncbi:hypothetical protein KPH14_008761 [Odynerus spinipes]|uniref:Cap-specific mRNA (nucleoside-2'-O-)-methyltransferase 2 n=1 Tax=Odynerus spinipes TaxID=1348599 RepID=A0AAD9VHT0_9HYME|nr:hypothetical protein KPH14_008761 [Odynerus spinipes]